jgi:hypothetical protein
METYMKGSLAREVLEMVLVRESTSMGVSMKASITKTSLMELGSITGLMEKSMTVSGWTEVFREKESRLYPTEQSLMGFGLTASQMERDGVDIPMIQNSPVIGKTASQVDKA